MGRPNYLGKPQQDDEWTATWNEKREGKKKNPVNLWLFMSQQGQRGSPTQEEFHAWLTFPCHITCTFIVQYIHELENEIDTCSASAFVRKIVTVARPSKKRSSSTIADVCRWGFHANLKYFKASSCQGERDDIQRSLQFLTSDGCTDYLNRVMEDEAVRES